MAYSKITIVFNTMPSLDSVLEIIEPTIGVSLKETFKNSRLSVQQVVIPLVTGNNYEMTISSSTDISNIDVEFTPIGMAISRVPLSSVPVYDNLDGTYTYKITSSTQVQIVDANSGNYIVWSEGSFYSTSGYSGYISDNYKTAFDLDYNTSNLFTTSSVSGNTVIISANYAGAVFQLGYNNSNAVVTIENSTQAGPIFITSVVFTKHLTNVKDYVTANVNTNVLATGYSIDNGPSLYVDSTINSFNYQMLRGSSGLLTVSDSRGNEASLNVKAPDILSAENTFLDILNSSSGAIVTVSHLNSYGLNLEYSLNNIDWQTSKVFNGLLIGSYTLYVRDQFTYSISKSFTVSIFSPDTNVKNQFSYLSKSMSIRFKRNQDFDNIDIYKTDNNTLSCEEHVLTPYKYIQKFKPNNLVKTQLLSNYSNISANIIKSDGSKDALVVERKIKFLDIKDKRDARIYNISNDKVGIYFNTGQLYDYDRPLVVSGTYALNGALPSYGAIGNYVKIGDLGWFKILDIIYNESLNADVLVFNAVFNSIDSPVIVSCNYNQKNFNVYEFSIDFAAYLDKTVQVEILQSSNGFEDYNYLSEKIEVSDYYENSVELIWYNDVDSFVFYSTGIKNVGNFEFSTFDNSNDSSLDIHKTPQTSIVIDSSNYELKTLVIEDVSTGIMHQLAQASLHKQILVNKVKFISNDDPDTEVVKFTNLYTVTLNLIKVGDIYNSDLTG